MLEIDMHVDHLADFIFTKNINNAIIELSLNGLESSKDFFFFCLDLFCKGLVLMFGDGSLSVKVNNIRMEQFMEMREKLRLAGIDVILDAQPPDIDIGPDDIYLNLIELQEMLDTLPLKDYKFVMKCCEFTYIIQFELFHRSDGACHSHRSRIL